MENANFFAALSAACEAQNAALDAKLAVQAAEAATLKTRQEEENKISRRNWATGVLRNGKLPVSEREKVYSAMKIAVNDPKLPRKEVEHLLLQQETYRPFISVGLIRDFLCLNGDPAGELGMYCIQRALEIPLESDPFSGDVANSLSMGLEILSKFNAMKRPEIARVYESLRKLFPFTRKGNLQNIPHPLGKQLYPERYDASGNCTYRFASRHEKGEARKVANNHRPRRDRPEESDKSTWEGMEMAANGKISGIRLIRAS